MPFSERISQPRFTLSTLRVSSLRTSRIESIHSASGRKHSDRLAGSDEPVVHLHVDVGVIVAAPGRPLADQPQALQVGRQAPSPGREQLIIR